MPRLLRFSLVSVRDLAATYGPATVLVVLVLVLAYRAIDPTPPGRVIIATGPANSAYEDFGARYKTFLARYGIEAELRQSAGSLQNLRRLDTDKSDADVAFVQSGTTTDEEADARGLVSLGSLFVEPVWIFYREAALAKVSATAKKKVDAITQLGELRGLSVNTGRKGSGGLRLARQLLAANRVDAAELTLSDLDDTPAVMKLLDGSLDAVLFVTAPESQLVQMLLQTPGIRLFNFEQAEAYSRRLPFLKHVVLPRGIVALERDIPHEDVHLIAPTATLVAKATVHPAIVELLVQAASDVHGGPGWFRRAGEFPNDQYSEIPVSPVAAHYYKSGPSFLQRYLPFWLANVVERMWLILVPAIALLIPLSRILPPLYTWRVRSRVYRWYGQLREVENEVDHASGDDGARDAARGKQLARLADIESRVNQLVVPLSYADELYALKLHIDRVRAKVGGAASPASPGLAPTANATAS